ncbi:hypothetical protein, partial [Pseudoalteromonas tunicata]
ENTIEPENTIEYAISDSDSEMDQILQQAISFCPQCLSTVVETKDSASGARIYTCSSHPLCDFSKTIP